MYSFTIFDEALDPEDVANLYAEGRDATMTDVKVAVGDVVLKPSLFIIK